MPDFDANTDFLENGDLVEVRRRTPAGDIQRVQVPFSSLATAATGAHNDDAGAHPDIRALISSLEGNGAAASAFGFLPTASGAENAVALQSAVDAGVGTIWVTIPGTYDMAAGVAVPSNCTLVFCSGVTLRKTAGFWSMFYASGIPTRTYTENVNLIGAWTVIDQNGQVSGEATAIPGLDPQPGIIDVWFTKNWIISGFVFDLQSGTHCFSVHGGENDGLIVENCVGLGNDDDNSVNHGRATFQLEAASRNFTFRNLRLRTNDDATAFTAGSYSLNTISVGDIENGILENITDLYLNPAQIGYTCRLISGAWSAWNPGSEYKLSDYANNDGKIYLVAGKTGGSFPLTAANAPTHTSGEVAGADGIIWRFLKVGTETNMNVRNIQLRNIYSTRADPVIVVTVDDDQYARTVYPGCDDHHTISGISAKGIKWAPAASADLGLFTMFGGNLETINLSDVATTLSGDASLITAHAGELHPTRIDTVEIDSASVKANTTRIFRTPAVVGSGIKNLLVKNSRIESNTGSGNNSTIFVGVPGDVVNYSLERCVLSNFPNLLAIAGNTTGVVLKITDNVFVNCTKIANTFGYNSPFTVIQSNCVLGGNAFDLITNNGFTGSDLRYVSDAPKPVYSVEAAGTAYTLSTTPAVVTFGTTNPVITLAQAGRYRIRARFSLTLDSLVFATPSVLSVFYRINGVQYVQRAGVFPVPSGSGTLWLELPELFLDVDASKVVTLQTSMTENYSAGTLEMTTATIDAIPVVA